MAAKVTAGLTASEARQQALIEFGLREHAISSALVDVWAPSHTVRATGCDAAQIAELYLRHVQYASGSEGLYRLNPSLLQLPFDRQTGLASDAYPICRWLWPWHSESPVLAIMEAEYGRSRPSL
jgi:hypothetical protein